jgi:hypothetical protein
VLTGLAEEFARDPDRESSLCDCKLTRDEDAAGCLFNLV